MKLLLPALTCGCALLCAPAHAEKFTGGDHDVSIELPEGWKSVGRGGFEFIGPNGEHIQEMELPSSAHDIRETARTLPSIEGDLGFRESGREDMLLDGGSWRGVLTLRRGAYGARKTPSTLMALVIGAPMRLRMFWLIASDESMRAREAQYLEILKSIDFRRRGPPPREPAIVDPPMTAPVPASG